MRPRSSGNGLDHWMIMYIPRPLQGGIESMTLDVLKARGFACDLGFVQTGETCRASRPGEMLGKGVPFSSLFGLGEPGKRGQHFTSNWSTRNTSRVRNWHAAPRMRNARFYPYSEALLPFLSGWCRRDPHHLQPVGDIPRRYQANTGAMAKVQQTSNRQNHS